MFYSDDPGRIVKEMGRARRKVTIDEEVDDPIGAAWLVRNFEIELAQPLRVQSGITTTRATVRHGGREIRLYQEASRPTPKLTSHLEFMLKHETLHLELLSRLFECIEAGEIASWVRLRPTSIYARRAGFFYEWLTRSNLDFEGVTNGGYVDALDSAKYLVGETYPVRRWRIRSNLLGDQAFCPLVVRTESTEAADRMNVSERWTEIEREFGEDVLRRSAVWITLRESRASFAIEHEGDERDRIKRFASVIEAHAGRYLDPLSEKALERIQREIVGERSLTYGLRRSPVLVGESGLGENTVHYIAPRWEDVPAMIGGLRRVLHTTGGLGPAVRAALLAFGLVYIHPFADGNGRMSRFLINDVLRRDGAVPAPFVLPVSAAILSDMREYDAILEQFSGPFMHRYANEWRFGKPSIAYPDGLTSDFHFDAYGDAGHAWRYPDLTEHVHYTAQLLRKTLDVEMRREARLLTSLRNARQAVKNVVEGPDMMIDRIVRSVRENDGIVSKKLRGEFPILEDQEIAEEVVEAIKTAFGEL